MTPGEIWIHYIVLKSRIQNKQWKHPDSPPLKKFKLVASVGKVMISVLGDSGGVIMID